VLAPEIAPHRKPPGAFFVAAALVAWITVARIRKARATDGVSRAAFYGRCVLAPAAALAAAALFDLLVPRNSYSLPALLTIYLVWDFPWRAGTGSATTSAVTNRRVLQINPILGNELLSFDLSSADPVISKEDFHTGNGMLLFEGQTVPFDLELDADKLAQTKDRLVKQKKLNVVDAELVMYDQMKDFKLPVMFLDVPNVREVHDLILRLKQQATQY